jgi:cardiolipin synthase A/B
MQRMHPASSLPAETGTSTPMAAVGGPGERVPDRGGSRVGSLARKRWRVARRVGVATLLALVVWLLISAAHGVRDLLQNTAIVVGDAGTGAAPATDDARFLRTVEVLTLTPLRPGNRAEVLMTGEVTFSRLWEDLRSATTSITVQMYYCEDSEIGETLVRLLAERARAGIPVFFLGDGYGCKDLPKRHRDELRAAGVRVATFRPVRWYSAHKAQHRSHGRIVVVDGRIGYTGGFGVSDQWYSASSDDWRESNVRFTGPSVTQLQGAFVTAWLEATGTMLGGEALFPEPAADGPLNAGVLFATPGFGSSVAERFLALSIAGARTSLYITNAYFVPNAHFRVLLIQAAARGVDVRVLTAGEGTDLRSVRYASRAHYDELLAGGLRIYEYDSPMMHGKSFVVDGLWSSVGSMNFDTRSLRLNDETVFLAHDREFGASMDSIFVEDLRLAREIELAEFRRRPWTERILERAANLVGWIF